MLEAIIQNLINVGWALLIFLAAYLANTVLSIWYNTKVLLERFSKEKLIPALRSHYHPAAFRPAGRLGSPGGIHRPIYQPRHRWDFPAGRLQVHQGSHRHADRLSECQNRGAGGAEK